MRALVLARLAQASYRQHMLLQTATRAARGSPVPAGRQGATLQVQESLSPTLTAEHSLHSRDSTHLPTNCVLSTSAPSNTGRQPMQDLPLAQCTHLQELYISDFALITQQTVMLQPGLTVITGSSGAGKSVLFSALSQILGAPAPENCIRPPASSAVVEGRLHLNRPAAEEVISLLRRHGTASKAVPELQPTGVDLRLRREIVKGDKKGSVRSKCFVNSAPVSQRMLRELGATLVDVNGQHAAQTLRDPATQIELLDRLAGTCRAAAQFGAHLAELRESEAELQTLDALKDETARDELQALADEIGSHSVQLGEERDLRRQLRQMDARKTNVQRCSLVRTAMVGDGSSGGVEDMMQSVEQSLRTILDQERAQTDVSREADGDDDDNDDRQYGASSGKGLIGGALEHLRMARKNLSAAERQVGSYARRYQFSEQEYASARERLDTLDRLLRKLRCSSSEELLMLKDKALADLDRWFNFQGSMEEHVANMAALECRLASEGASLSKQRREAAGKLRVAVEGCLSNLAMSGTRFDVRIGWDPAAQGGITVSPELAAAAHEEGGRAFQAFPQGLDRVEFLLAAGPADPMRPLSAVASGGERSRIMLALKAAPAAIQLEEAGDRTGELSQQLGAPIIVLDEVDSGVGGRLGMPVGKLLQQMVSRGTAGPSQVLCVSHLPQVAASAEHHLCVRKSVLEDGRVLTHFASLSNDRERCQEIAAMGGMREEEALNMMSACSTTHS